MAAVQSNMLPLGSLAEDFYLPDTISGNHYHLHDLKGEQGTLVLFICNHCPYVLHIKSQLIEIASFYATLGVNSIAISANDVEKYPQDAPDKMQSMMVEWGNPFTAYLYDESQEIARSYQAACTPDIYLFDKDLHCVYRGRLDGSTPNNNVPLNGNELRAALDALLAGIEISEQQIPSIGCSIKWKA